MPTLTRRAVALATALLALVLVAWALVTPAFRGPDEPEHVSTALRLALGGGYPAPGAAEVIPEVRGTFALLGFPGSREVSQAGPLGADPGWPSDVPTMAELAAGPGLPAATPDQMTQHPPAFYAALAAPAAALDLQSWAPPHALLLLRLLSAALLLPVPWLVARTGLALGLSPSTAGAASFVPAGWIQLTHIGATVNNGTLLVLAASLLGWGLVQVIQAGTRVRTGVFVGATLSVALLTKGFALAFLPAVVAAYVVAWRRGHHVGRSAVAAAVLSVPGVAWWVGNVVRFGEVQPSAVDLAVLEADRGLGDWALEFVDRLSWSAWAGLGWLETPLPALLHVPATLGALLLVAIGTWRLRQRWAEMAVLHVLWVGPLGVAALGSLEMFLESNLVLGANGRYLQTGVLALAVGMAAAVLTGRLAVLAPLAAGVAALAGLLFGLRHFWLPEPLPVGSPDGWWPVPAGTTATLLVLIGVLGVSSSLVLARSARHSSSGPRLRAMPGPVPSAVPPPPPRP